MLPGLAFDGAGRGGLVARRSRVQRNAASVLPLPVGAWISVCRPAEIAAQPSAWAGVGAAKELSNQARTAGENGASGSSPRASGAVEAGGLVDTVATGRWSIGVGAETDRLFEFALGRRAGAAPLRA